MYVELGERIREKKWQREKKIMQELDLSGCKDQSMSSWLFNRIKLFPAPGQQQGVQEQNKKRGKAGQFDRCVCGCLVRLWGIYYMLFKQDTSLIKWRLSSMAPSLIEGFVVN